MDKVRSILTTITIIITVMPIAGVMLINQNNLLGLIVPPEINTVINNLIIPEEQLEESFGNITFVDSQYDVVAQRVTSTFEFMNPLQFDVVVDSMSADVRCDEHDFPLGHLIINNPVEIGAGETATISATGTWTQDALQHFLSAHAGAKKIDIELTGLSVTVNGVSIQTDEIVKIPSFPVM